MKSTIQPTNDCLPGRQLSRDVLKQYTEPHGTQQQGPHPIANSSKETKGRFLPWEIVHWQVENGFTDIELAAPAGGIMLVFWCKEIPLGQVAVPASMLPLSRDQLSILASRVVAPAVKYHFLDKRYEFWSLFPKEQQPPFLQLSRRLRLNRPIEALSRSETGRPPTNLSVSVVICTRNRPEYLKRCLSSIEALSPSPEEVIVVDNDPSSGLTHPVVEHFRNVLYIPEPHIGLSAARNTGLRRCRGDVIAFTDDDAVVHPRWIGAICSAFNEADVMAVTGLVLPAEIETPAQYVFQTGSLGCEFGFRGLDFGQEFFRSTQKRGTPVWRIGAGANMAFRREAFEIAGLFDERLGAGNSGCSEDSELWYRLLAKDYRCRYNPVAVVFHSHRREWKELCDQAHQYMRGHVAALLFQYDRHRHWGNLHRAFIALPWEYSRLLLTAARHKIGTILYKTGSDIPACPVVPQIRGVLAGWYYYLRHRTAL